MHTQVFTAGYTSLKPVDLLVAAESLDAYLVDIRISPYSRVEYWMGSHLKVVWGARYQHIKALGNINYKNPADGIKLRDAETGTMQLAQLMLSKPVILICACKNHETCHRSVAAQEMADRYNMEVIHLTAKEILNMGKPAEPEAPQQLNLI